MTKCDFNKVLCNFIEITLRHGCLLHIFRTPSTRNTSGWLLLNAALAITGAIRRSSNEKLCQELCFEYLSYRGLSRKFCLFYKIVVNKSPNYLSNYV